MTLMIMWGKWLLFTILVMAVDGNPTFLHRVTSRASNNNTIDSIFALFPYEKNPISESIRLRVYTGESVDVAAIADIPISAVDEIYEYIDHTKPLVIYIHGFREHPSNESIRTVVGAYLERGTDNIFLLDWSDLARGFYLDVVKRVKPVAEVLAKTFDALVDLGLNLETFHCVGHSLGGQVGGLFGKYSKYSIPRITGLDPANPGFYYPGSDHIDSDSARFVDIIHTDGGFYGALDNTGTVDFFANGGSRPQPGCYFLGIPVTPSDLCSHWRSWEYYAESVNNNYAFPATQCSSFLPYKLGECHKNRKVFYGYSVPTDTRGSYHFTTNSKSPYGNNASYFL